MDVNTLVNYGFCHAILSLRSIICIGLTQSDVYKTEKLFIGPKDLENGKKIQSNISREMRSPPFGVSSAKIITLTVSHNTARLNGLQRFILLCRFV